MTASMRLAWSGVALLAGVVASGCSAGLTTPQPTHKLSPSKPIPGHVVFTDNFADPSSGWQNNLNSGHSGYTSGGYVLAGYANETEYSPAPYWSDLIQGIRIAVDATESHGDPGVTYYGVGCGDRRDRDPEYEFLISADGEYLIDSAGSSPKNLLAAGTAPIHPNGQVNHIEATCIRGAFPNGTRGTQLGLLINGQAVASAVDTRYGEAPAWTGGVLTSSWTTSRVGVIFHRFSMVDELPVSLTEQNPPRVVYRNNLRDPFTGWLNTNSYDEIQGKYVEGGQWQLQAAGGTSSWVPSPYTAQDLTSITVSVNVHYVAGAKDTSAGTACFDAATGKGVFAFSLDTRGYWAISYDDGSRYLRDLASGRTSVHSEVVSATCGSGPGNKSHVALSVGSTQIATATASAPPPQHWNGGVCVITYQGDPTATFAFRDFTITRIT